MTRPDGRAGRGDALEFRLLGNLEVVANGAPVDVGGSQPRTVLAMLLVAGGRVVPADAIVAALWGDTPPGSAAGTLQSYVSRLRRALVPGGARGEAAKVLAWDPPGYKLVVPPDALDARSFEGLADEGRAALAGGDPATARALLAEALALWRGPALLEFAHLDFAWGFAAKLEERRLVATEDRIAADLRLGGHVAVIGELVELVVGNPLREQLRHHLALALYRSGRQAEALRVLDDARRTLRDQLGIDPGRPLVELESAILVQDPALNAAPAGAAAAGDSRPRASGPGPPGEGASGAGTAGVGRAAGRDPDDRRGSAGGEGGAHGAGVGSPGSARPALVGREDDLRRAVAALDEARSRACVVLVEGEPGIGKTRLLEELSAEAGRRGAAVHWGHAFEGGATPAFWPWLPVVRRLVAASGPAGAAPELAGLLEQGDGGAERADPSRYRVFSAVTALLAEAARATPLVVVLDDLQWADLASLELLAFAAHELDAQPVLLAGTVRQMEVGRNDEVVETLAALSRVRATRRIELRGLSPRHTAELVRAVAGRDLEPDVVAVIQERAEGNPFFATELARLVEHERRPGRAVGGEAPTLDVPSGVRDVVRRRLALLPEPTLRLVQVAAVAGREADLDVLLRASGRDVDEVLDELDPALVHRLVVAVGDRPGTFRFAHALVREVVADDVPPLRRARIHLRVADALEATAGDRDDTAEILAEHLWAAAPVGVGRRAAAALERGAEVAVRRYALDAAERMLERAVQLRRSGGEADVEAELAAVSRLLSVQRSRHGYATIAGSPNLRRAEELAVRLARPDVLARLLWSEWAAHDSHGDHARADAIAERLHALAGESDDPLVQVTGLASAGIGRWHRGRITEATAVLDEAVRVGSAAPAPAMTLGLDLEVLLLPYPFSRYLHVLAGDAGGPAEAEAGFEALADASPDRYGVALVETLASAAAVTVGAPEWAVRAAERGLAADPEMTFAFWSRSLQGYLAAAMIDLGDVEAGVPLLDEAMARYLEAGGRTGIGIYQASRVVGLVGAGRLAAAAEALAEAERELDDHGERFTEPLIIEADARLRLARGDDPGEVAATFGRARALALEQGARGVAGRVAATAARLGVAPTRH